MCPNCWSTQQPGLPESFKWNLWFSWNKTKICFYLFKTYIVNASLNELQQYCFSRSSWLYMVMSSHKWLYLVFKVSLMFLDHSQQFPFCLLLFTLVLLHSSSGKRLDGRKRVLWAGEKEKWKRLTVVFEILRKQSFISGYCWYHFRWYCFWKLPSVVIIW